MHLTLVDLFLCPQGPQQWGAPSPSLSQWTGDSSACRCFSQSYFLCLTARYIFLRPLTPDSQPPLCPSTGGELHSVFTGRLRQIRTPLCLDTLQSWAPGQHRRRRFNGQGHADETQVHRRLADTRYGNNVRNPNRRKLLFHFSDWIITLFSMS